MEQTMLNEELLSDDKVYYSIEANEAFCSASQYKDFIGYPLKPGCEERALKTIRGLWVPETTKALLQGSILDALWENDDPDYIMQRFPECVASRGATKGQLKADFQDAVTWYQTTLRQEKFCAYMSGEKQKVFIGEIEGLPFKIKIDSFHDGKAIVDLKTTRTLDRNYRFYIHDSGEKLPFYMAFGYDIQLAIYQEVVRQKTGDKLPCYLACVDKQPFPICDIIEIPQKRLDEALEGVRRHCATIIGLKSGDIEPTRCNHSDCDYCRETHICEVLSAEEFEANDIPRDAV